MFLLTVVVYVQWSLFSAYNGSKRLTNSMY